jgi:hypothetical protein
MMTRGKKGWAKRESQDKRGIQRISAIGPLRGTNCVRVYALIERRNGYPLRTATD